MVISDFIYKEQVRQSSDATAIIEMLTEFQNEIANMPEFHLKSARYIAYSVAYGNDNKPVIQRHVARTLKSITALSGEVGGLYNHTFKWNDLDSGLPGIQWAYVENLKKPLVAVAVLKYRIALGELKGQDHGEAAC